jgi:23S rRNA (adenine2030-N6)-methyltransferase
MNYRHIYHAGNFADVFKHVFLVRVLRYLMLKESPLRFLDTHAGAGLYKVAAEEAQRTAEWQGGVGRVLDAEIPAAVRNLLTPWMQAAGLLSDSARLQYPGSPLLAQRLLRSVDKLTLCELHETDARALSAALGRDRRVKSLRMDGYLALNAYVPPTERRGLVLVDPPFEDPDEFSRIVSTLESAWRKWPTGTYMVWYPRKDLAAVGRFKTELSRGPMRRVLCLECDVAAPLSDEPLAGSGLVIVNPPHVLESEARTILPFLTKILARGPGAAWSMGWIAGE